MRGRGVAGRLWKCAADANAAVAGSYGDCSGCGRGTDDRTDCRSYGDLDPHAHANSAAIVHADAKSARAAAPESSTADGIIYTKEQQWKVDFNTVKVAERELRSSLIATGNIRPRADGEVYLSAASTGSILASDLRRAPIMAS